MATPRRQPTIAMLTAEEATRKALARAVAEHEAEQAAQENLAMGGLQERYRPFAAGLAKPGTKATPTPNMTPTPRMTRDQQGIVDAFWDENDRWAARDESGKPIVTATRIDLPIMGRGLERDVAAVEADDARVAAALAERRRAATPVRRRV